ncbi:hypothetical protein [Desulfurella sp.]|uniref:hypothetical protein n=1 Tax=Desulfurella sp. TaxID=1962857 RepID=UPI003D13B5A9
MQKGLERIKKAYLILDDNLLARLLQYLLTSEGWSVEWVDDPRQMKEEIFNYNLILIGNHKGITTKVKLAEAFLEKINSGNLAPGLVKPSILILKDESDVIPNGRDVIVIQTPSFHKEIFSAISNIDSKLKTLEKISLENFKEVNLGEFLNSIRSNQKISFWVGNKQLKIIIIGSEINFLHSDFDNYYDIFQYNSLYVSQDIIDISDLSNISNENTPRLSLKSFIWEGIKNITNKDSLLALLPKDRNIINVKAPLYAVRGALLPGSNLDIEWLMNNSDLSIDKIMRRYNYDNKVLQNIVIMYMLRIIDLSSDQDAIVKFDVKIKKGVLHKILDKIRGL